MAVSGISDIYARGIFFLSDSPTFSYAATCLADGLSQLGVPIHANISYSDPLICDFRFECCADPARQREACCVLIDIQDSGPYNGQNVRITPPHEMTLALCMQDNVGEFCIDGVSAFLCTHENHFRILAGRRVPIAFGLSSSMIRRSMGLGPAERRNGMILRNFRPSLSQELRACLDLVLVPGLQRHFSVDTRIAGDGRWHDDYYGLLRSSLGCLAYGGYFAQDLSKNEYFMRDDTFRAFLSSVAQGRETVVLRWDSWRFWESLLFGCLTLHLDFKEYGFMLPVMPENWRHYVGINLADVRRDVERLMDERNRWDEIAWNGRMWAIEHYSPLAVARRFVKLLQGLFDSQGSKHVLG